MRMRRTALSLILPAVATLALAAPAAAQTDVPQGVLAANGAGVVILDGDAAMLGVVRGPALLVLQDRAGDARLSVGGRVIRPLRVRPAPPFVTVRRYRLETLRRRFILSGTNMRVRIESGDLSVTAAGHFRVRLQGSGSYTVDNGQPQAWVAGTTVKVGLSTPRRTRRG